MNGQILTLPIARTAFVTVTRTGQHHVVQLVKPSPLPGGTVREFLYSMNCSDLVTSMARGTAARLRVPFRSAGTLS